MFEVSRNPTQRWIRLLRWRGRLPYGPLVSNRAQVLLIIAAVTGLNPMTVELILRYLGKAGLVPKGLPGRRSAHYTIVHLKNLVLALAAYLPSDAVDAVQKLNDLPCDTNALTNIGSFHLDIPIGTLFGDWITREIEARVLRTERVLSAGEQQLPLRLRQGRFITMSVFPPTVRVLHPVHDLETVRYHIDTFGTKKAAKDSMPVLSREATFTDELLNAVANLLADTPAAQADTPIPDLAPGRAGEGDDATPETTKAAGSGNHDGLLDIPATRTRRQRSLNKAQPIASQGRKQSCPDGAVSELRGSYPPAAKDHYHGTLWTDAASP